MTVKKPLTGEKRKSVKKVKKHLTVEKRKSERKKVKKPMSYKIPVVKPNIITSKWKRYLEKNPTEREEIIIATPRTQYVSLFLIKELVGESECHPRIKNQYGETKHAGIYFISNSHGRSYITCNYEGVTMQRSGLPPSVDSSCAEHIKDCLLNSTTTVLFFNSIFPGGGGHANLLIIQKDKNNNYYIFRFEPHGAQTLLVENPTEFERNVGNAIIEFMKNVVFENEPIKPIIKYYGPHVACPSQSILLRGSREYSGIQMLEKEKYRQEIDNTGFCFYWSLWMLLIALYNRKRGKRVFTAHNTAYRFLKQKNGAEQRMNFIRNFAKLLRLIEFESMNKDEKGIEKVVKKYKDCIKTESLNFV